MAVYADGLKPLCDTCLRHQYPCRCHLAKDDIVIVCDMYIKALDPDSARRNFDKYTCKTPADIPESTVQ